MELKYSSSLGDTSSDLNVAMKGPRCCRAAPHTQRDLSCASSVKMLMSALDFSSYGRVSAIGTRLSTQHLRTPQIGSWVRLTYTGSRYSAVSSEPKNFANTPREPAATLRGRNPVSAPNALTCSNTNSRWAGGSITVHTVASSSAAMTRWSSSTRSPASTCTRGRTASSTACADRCSHISLSDSHAAMRTCAFFSAHRRCSRGTTRVTELSSAPACTRKPENL
mmetsp:Transcript_11472/g.28893  ORF Transcript_11472/g.28893 Transcript_11472/m.28893 type:complete len:223 (+) Transcript_11472:1137-1805(+)